MAHLFSLVSQRPPNRKEMFTKLIQYLERIRECTAPAVLFVKMNPLATVPSRHSSLCAGFDLSSAESLILAPHQRALVHTGIRVAPPKFHHIEIRPRSGLALKYGVTVLNAPGTIDADYRGEIMVLMFNTSDAPFPIEIGDRIAQAVVMQHAEANWICVSELDSTDRNENGFGSTGIR